MPLHDYEHEITDQAGLKKLQRQQTAPERARKRRQWLKIALLICGMYALLWITGSFD